MSGYLLLRDNKQTGPFTPEELITKGFKPYDLIWAEGKSAGWRYPSEFPEFSKYAPIVEEQPFDRFYKKPSANQNNQSEPRVPAFNKPEVVVEVAEQKAEPAKQPELIKEVVEERAPAKVIAIKPKKIFVTLPSNAEIVKPEPITTPAATANSNLSKAIAEEKQVISDIETKAAEIKEKILAAQQSRKETIPAEKKPADKYSQKEYSSYNLTAKETSSFVEEKTYSARQEEKIVAHTYNAAPTKMRALTMGAIAACLILAGVVIGLVISGTKQTAEQQQLDALVKRIQDRQSNKEQATPVQTASVMPDQPVPAEPSPVRKEEIKKDEQENIAKPAVHKPAEEQTTNNVSQEPKVIPAVQKAAETVAKKESNIAASDRKQEEKVDEAAAASARKNILQLVSVSGNKYKVGVLGGISNLEVTVSNNSLYPLDEVEVTVNYHGPEKRIVRTETITINDVAAGEQKAVSVPKSKRGVSVSYIISKINSRALGLAHSGL